MNPEIINYIISILGMSYAVYVMNTKLKSGDQKMFNMPIKHLKLFAFTGIGIFTSLLILSLFK